MNKLALLSLALLTTNSTFAASTERPISPKPWENSSQDVKVINICNLTDIGLSEIMEGHHPELAVEFSAKTAMPIRFFLTGDLFKLIENEGNSSALEIGQTFYARYVEQELILSVDLKDWKPFLEFITGNASVSLNIQNGQPSIIVGAETNRKS